MDTHPHDSGDLTELERRLSSWRPAAAGLDADAMLFAAGQAAAPPRPGHLVWPALTGLLAVLSVALGTWALAERSGRLALVPPPAPAVPLVQPSVPALAEEPATADEPAPPGLLGIHRALEWGWDTWSNPAPEAPEVPGAIPPTPVLMVGHRDVLLDP